MRWSAVAPVTWPSDEGFHAWWRAATADAVGGGAIGDGPVGDGTIGDRAVGGGAVGDGPIGDGGDVAGVFEVDGEHVRLVSGEPLRPGAVYRWIPPEGGVVGSAAWGIGGRPDRRDVYLEYQENANPRRRVVVRVDGLDACGSASATSTLKHLGAEASFVPERDRLLDIEVTLDWLLVQVRARVAPAEAGEQLRVTLRVVGRGLWKPIVAPLLVPLGIPLRHLLTSETEEAADRLTHLDEDPRGNGAPERELARIREGAELIRSRLHEVVRTVDARPFWRGRGQGALQEAFAALPAVGAGWPTVSPAITFGASGRWWDEEQWIFDALIDRNPWRRKRHELVDDQVDLWLSQQELLIEHREKAQAEHAAADVAKGDLSVATAAQFNELMDLSWLASPWSAIRHLVRKAREEDEDLPQLDTDEDARRFLASMLEDL